MSNSAFSVTGVTGGTVTNVATGTGLSGGPITTTGTINVVINDFCNGRLTLTSGVPVVAPGDVLAATTIYWTPYKGNYITLYTAAIWTLYSFSELSISVPGTTNTNYDVFVYDSGGGVLALHLVAWTNNSTRATALATQDGIYVLTGAHQYRYVGTFRTTSVAGQTEDSTSNRFLWNYYNRVLKLINFTMSTPSWTYNVIAYRQANANPAAQLNFVIGLIEDGMYVSLGVSFTNNENNPSYVAIGLNSTSSPSGNVTISSASIGGSISSAYCNWFTYPENIGYNYLAWLELNAYTGTTTFYGSNGLGTSNDSSISSTFFC